MKYYIPTIIIVLVDQLSKIWIKNNMLIYETRNIFGDILRFTYVRNPGIAFGISVGDYTVILVILSIFATLFVFYLHWNERKNHPLLSYGLAFILGGAIGNLIDRLSVLFVAEYKGVVDFIDIGTSSYRWYTFNIADTAVTIGMILYILHGLIIHNTKFIKEDV